MNANMVKAVSVMTACLLMTSGCAFLEEHKGAAIGAGAGAVGGAAIGGLAKGKKGAIVGGLLGALAGGAIGAYVDYKNKSAEETNKDQGYQPSQGVRIDLVNATVEPGTASPGGKVTLQMTYAVMAPDSKQEVVVTEDRLVTLGSTKVAETRVGVGRTPGTYVAKVPITLPKDAGKGTYKFKAAISAAGMSKELTSRFVVQ